MSDQPFGTLSEFLSMLDRVHDQAEQDEKDFWIQYPDGLDIEYTDGEVKHLEGPSEESE